MTLQATIRKFFLIAAGALLTAGLSDPALAQAKYVLKLGHVLAPQNHYHVTSLEFARLVKEKTGGKVEVQVFPQAQLGGEIQATQALRTGTQDLTIVTTTAIENTVKEWEIFDLPYLFNSIDEGNAVMQGPVGKKFLDMLPKYNLTGLCWFSVLERNVFTTKKPIGSLNDISTMKIRVMQGPGYISGYRALGANPTPMAYSQLFLALQQGLVDGADASPDQMIQDKFYEVSKFYQLTHIQYSPVIFMIGKPSLDKLPPDLQTAVREAGVEACKFDIARYRKDYEEGLATLKSKGMEIRTIDTQPWIKASEASLTSLLKDIPDGPALYKDIVAARSAAK